jgi:hypothetical protein
MIKSVINICLAVFILTLFLPFQANAFDLKTYIGQPFKYFDVEDIYNQRWISTYLRGKPLIMLTAHRHQKYEVAKWAEAFRQEFGLPGTAHLLWIVNMRRCPWTVSKREVLNQWRAFNATIPVIMDWNGTIGRSLRVNYNVPNIIVLDAYGRLAMHEMHTFNFEVYSAVAARIRTLCSGVPNYVSAPFSYSAPKGKKGYSI